MNPKTRMLYLEKHFSFHEKFIQELSEKVASLYALTGGTPTKMARKWARSTIHHSPDLFEFTSARKHLKLQNTL